MNADEKIPCLNANDVDNTVVSQENIDCNVNSEEVVEKEGFCDTIFNSNVRESVESACEIKEVSQRIALLETDKSDDNNLSSEEIGVKSTGQSNICDSISETSDEYSDTKSVNSESVVEETCNHNLELNDEELNDNRKEKKKVR